MVSAAGVLISCCAPCVQPPNSDKFDARLETVGKQIAVPFTDPFKLLLRHTLN
jgi:hypothetical protein